MPPKDAYTMGCKCMESDTAPIPMLPSNAVLTLLAEGAANILYRISIPKGTPVKYHADAYPLAEGFSESNPFEGKLLRLRKCDNLRTDTDDTVDTLTAHRQHLEWTHRIFVEQHLVHQRLVYLEFTDHWFEKLNGHLEQSEIADKIPDGYPHRPEKRRGVYLNPDSFGLLVTDMTPAEGFLTVEFKPKWLLQSRSAPPFARRCRNCARRAQMAQDEISQGEAKSTTAPSFCPIALKTENPILLWETSRKVLASQKFCEAEGLNFDQPKDELKHRERRLIREMIAIFSNTVKGRGILGQLSHYQDTSDPCGIMRSLIVNEERRELSWVNYEVRKNFGLAMTLRDVTLYVRISDGKLTNSSSGFALPEIRVGDLDYKNAAAKGTHWYVTERNLIDGRWYGGRSVQGNPAAPPEGLCGWAEAIREHLSFEWQKREMHRDRGGINGGLSKIVPGGASGEVRVENAPRGVKRNMETRETADPVGDSKAAGAITGGPASGVTGGAITGGPASGVTGGATRGSALLEDAREEDPMPGMMGGENRPRTPPLRDPDTGLIITRPRRDGTGMMIMGRPKRDAGFRGGALEIDTNEEETRESRPQSPKQEIQDSGIEDTDPPAYDEAYLMGAHAFTPTLPTRLKTDETEAKEPGTEPNEEVPIAEQETGKTESNEDVPIPDQETSKTESNEDVPIPDQETSETDSEYKLQGAELEEEIGETIRRIRALEYDFMDCMENPEFKQYLNKIFTLTLWMGAEQDKADMASVGKNIEDPENQAGLRARLKKMLALQPKNVIKGKEHDLASIRKATETLKIEGEVKLDKGKGKEVDRDVVEDVPEKMVGERKGG